MVFVLDKRKRPLMPCSEKRARLLLQRGRAVIHRQQPFTIRLKDRVGGEIQPLRLKLDPGSQTTGVSLVREQERVDGKTGEVHREAQVLHLAEIAHRGEAIREALSRRLAYRRRRRSANLRYRPPRFNHRTRPSGWLPPSLQSRVDHLFSWTKRCRQLAPVSAISIETVRFDTQALQAPEISGVEYQRGELFGYEVREYLLEKWGRKCAYCGRSDIPLEIEHIVPQSRGGSDRVSNLTLACRPCNQAKGNQTAEEFGKAVGKDFSPIARQAKAPLKDAAAVNATRWAVLHSLKTTGLPIEVGTGGRTKWNRTRLGIPKSHALDATCVGAVEAVEGWDIPVLGIRATGRGAYQRTRVTSQGFPRGYLTCRKQVHGFQTGDRVKAIVPQGKKAGVYVGRVAVRASGFFNLQTPNGTVQGISWKCCRLLQRGDGYGYHMGRRASSRPVNGTVPAPKGVPLRAGVL